MESDLATTYAISKQENNGVIITVAIADEEVVERHLLNELKAMDKLQKTRLDDFNALGVTLKRLLAERQDMLKVAKEIQRDYPEQDTDDHVQNIMTGRP